MQWMGRLRNIFRREKMEQELDEELRSHIELRVEENIAAGMTPEEARYDAQRRFGNWMTTKEDTRETHLIGWLETTLQDLRYAARMLWRSPGFAVVAVTLLALGIGATTTIFSVVNGVLLRPLRYPHPERLMMVWEKDNNGSITNMGYATFTDWRAQNHSFADMAAMSYWQPTLSGEDEPERLNGQRVTSGFFRTLGVTPALGRDFTPQEDVRGNHFVVILSHALWQRRFGSNLKIIGRPIQLGTGSYTVVGVLPADYASELAPQSEIWAPLAYNETLPYACRDCRHLRAIGRIAPSASLASAGAEMNTISERLFRDYPKSYSNPGVILVPLQEQIVDNVHAALWVLLGAVGFVMLITCANVMNLMLSRAAQRQKETAIRLALGASRGRLVRQWLVEALLVSLLGALAGVLLATWGVDSLRTWGPPNLPRLNEVRLDAWAVAFAAGVAIVTTLSCGIAPGLQTRNPDVNSALKEGGRTGASDVSPRFRSFLVVTDIAISLVLLAGAGLMVRSLWRLLRVDPGFSPQNVLTMEVSLQGQKFAGNESQGLPQVSAFYAEAMERIRAIPGVESAGAASQIPLGGNMDMYGMHVEGKEKPNPSDDPSADRYAVTLEYLHTLRIPILRGRGFSEQDTATSPPVLLINETFAKRMFPGEDPIGKRLKMGGTDAPWRTIVGIVGDVHHRALDAERTMQAYLPHAQWSDTSMVLAIRGSLPTAALASAARQAIWSVDRNQPVTNVISMQEFIAANTEQRRFVMLLLSGFAGLAVLSAAIGIYGALSLLVTQRTHEIGIRMALGAQQWDVLRETLQHGLRLTSIGLAVGLAGALALSETLTALLYGVGPRDPATLAEVVLLLLFVALMACSVPALRASRVDPMEALRYE
jgi:putative ABC transport system permease protein